MHCLSTTYFTFIKFSCERTYDIVKLRPPFNSFVACMVRVNVDLI